MAHWLVEEARKLTGMGCGSWRCSLRIMRMLGMSSGTVYGYALTYEQRPRIDA